jgi:hypothetical protein
LLPERIDLGHPFINRSVLVLKIDLPISADVTHVSLEMLGPFGES